MLLLLLVTNIHPCSWCFVSFVVRRSSLGLVLVLVSQVRLPDGGRLPVVLLANKCDLDLPIDRSVGRSVGRRTCQWEIGPFVLCVVCVFCVLFWRFLFVVVGWVPYYNILFRLKALGQGQTNNKYRCKHVQEQLLGVASNNVYFGQHSNANSSNTCSSSSDPLHTPMFFNRVRI